MGGRGGKISWLRNVPATCVSQGRSERGDVGEGGGGRKRFLGCVVSQQHVYLKDGVRGGRWGEVGGGGKKDFLVA